MKDHARAHFCAQKKYTFITKHQKNTDTFYWNIPLPDRLRCQPGNGRNIIRREQSAGSSQHYSAHTLFKNNCVKKNEEKKGERSSQETAPEIKEIEVVKSCSIEALKDRDRIVLKRNW